MQINPELLRLIAANLRVGTQLLNEDCRRRAARRQEAARALENDSERSLKHQDDLESLSASCCSRRAAIASSTSFIRSFLLYFRFALS
jgi:hypothetical protein